MAEKETFLSSWFWKLKLDETITFLALVRLFQLLGRASLVYYLNRRGNISNAERSDETVNSIMSGEREFITESNWAFRENLRLPKKFPFFCVLIRAAIKSLLRNEKFRQRFLADFRAQFNSVKRTP